jgi:RNA polymerase sigma factor (sigma-70 family)
MGAVSDVTRILSQIESGDPAAAEQLLPLVYDELRKLAAAKLAQERPGQTLQATALMHEAYLRLVGERGQRSEVRGQNSEEPPASPTSGIRPLTSAPSFSSRGHFFAAAAEAMRRILIENARRKNRLKHGGDLDRVEVELADLPTRMAAEELIALDEALEKLRHEDPLKAQLVTLRFFGGLTVEQASEVLNISRVTAFRHWTYARAWLHREITGGADQPPKFT